MLSKGFEKISSVCFCFLCTAIHFTWSLGVAWKLESSTHWESKLGNSSLLRLSSTPYCNPNVDSDGQKDLGLLDSLLSVWLPFVQQPICVQTSPWKVSKPFKLSWVETPKMLVAEIYIVEWYLVNSNGAITLSRWKIVSKSPAYLTVKLAQLISTHHLVSWAHYVPELIFFFFPINTTALH